VFGHSKYDACHVALERSGADVNELCRLGIELQRALGQFEASLKSFLFNESGIGWDADKLRNPKRWVCRRSCPLGREGRGSVAMFFPQEKVVCRHLSSRSLFCAHIAPRVDVRWNSLR